MNCAGAFGTECVLSPEIGLAMPAAFLYIHSGMESHLKMILAPRVRASVDNAGVQHVRVQRPGGDGMTDTKTFLFNKSVEVEYLDGRTRRMESTIMSGEDGYCVQLLREAFESECWRKID